MPATQPIASDFSTLPALTVQQPGQTLAYKPQTSALDCCHNIYSTLESVSDNHPSQIPHITSYLFAIKNLILTWTLALSELGTEMIHKRKIEQLKAHTTTISSSLSNSCDTSSTNLAFFIIPVQHCCNK
jgi:hypothetical protein